MKNKLSRNQEDCFLKNNDCIFKKYKPIQKIGHGAFGDVYLTKRIKDEKLFAMKVKKSSFKDKHLETEAYFLLILQGFGIPKFISYGRVKNYNILIETLLDKNLFEIMEIQKNLSLKDICLIGIQILDRIEWIHSKNIIYRDIKPENFLIGKDDPNVIYIIDFGLCKKYRSSKTGKHILPRNTGIINGTIKYSSVYVLSAKESSRRDDLIALGYMLIYLYKGSLPWDFKIKDFNYQIYQKILNLKRTNSNGTLFNNLPKEFAEYINYNNNLKFEQEPDYIYLRSLFNKILFDFKFDYKNMIFSWILSKQVNLVTIPRNNSIKASSSHSRLFKHIKNSLQNSSKKAKNMSYEKRPENIPIFNNRIINNIKNENNIGFINNKEMINIQKNAIDINQPLKSKIEIFKEKLDNSNIVNNYIRNNNKSLNNISNNSNNYTKSFQNDNSYENIVNRNSNINKKNYLINKDNNKIKKINNNSKKQKIYIKLMNSNIKKDHNSFKDTFKSINNVRGKKRNYILSNSYNNSAKDKKKFIKNNIDNSSFKHFIQKANSKRNLSKCQTNFFNYQILSNYMPKDVLTSKFSKLTIDNNNIFELDNKNILQNKEIPDEKINIIYIKNKFNIIRKREYKIPIPINFFPNAKYINEEGKYSLQIKLKKKPTNLKNQKIYSPSSFSNNINNITQKSNKDENTYRSIFERIQEINSFL